MGSAFACNLMSSFSLKWLICNTQVQQLSVDVEWSTSILEILGMSPTSRHGFTTGRSTSIERKIRLNSESRQPHEVSILQRLTEKYVEACVKWIVEGFDGVNYCKKPVQMIHQTELNMVKQLCTLLDTLLKSQDESLFHDTKVT